MHRFSSWQRRLKGILKQPPLDWWLALNKTPVLCYFLAFTLIAALQAFNFALDVKTRRVAYPLLGAAGISVVSTVVLAKCPLTGAGMMIVIMSGLLAAAALLFTSTVFSDDLVFRFRSQAIIFIVWAMSPPLFGFPFLPTAILLGGLVVLETATSIMFQAVHGDPFEPRVAASSVALALGSLLATCMQIGRLRSIYDVQHELSMEKALMESMLAMMCDATVWLSDDGGRIVRADQRFEVLVGRNAAGKPLTGSLPEEEHRRVQDCVQRARTSPVLLPTTLATEAGARIPVEIFVVGNRSIGKADGVEEQMPAFLVGVKVTGRSGVAEMGAAEMSREHAAVLAQRLAGDAALAGAPADEELQSVAQLSSLPETTVTGHIFDPADVDHWLQGTEEDQKAEMRSCLARVDALGQAEHWLVHRRELQLDPNGLLGTGSFGFVVAGWLHGSPVAVKAAKSSEGVSVKRLLSILNEMRVLRHVRHPNLVLFHGSCVEPEQGEALLVLERVMGPDLTRYVAEHSADAEVDRRHQLLLDVACALRYLHAQRPVILHGDLKGSNILVEAQVPRAKLADFGLSRLLTKDAKPLGGSFAWMAPEIILRHGGAPNPSSDVFSFGRLVYMILACRPPLAGIRAEAIKEMARAGVTPRLAWDEGRPLWREAAALCERALSLAPERRPDMCTVHREATEWELPGHEAQTPAPEPAREDRGGLAGALRSLRVAVGGAAPARAPAGQAPGDAAGEAGATGAAGGSAAGVAGGARPQAPASASLESGPPPLMLPGRLPTEQYCKGFTLLEVMECWNSPVPHGACCRYHVAISELPRIARRLMGSACQRDFRPHQAYQCRECGILAKQVHAVCPVCNQPAVQDPGLAIVQEDAQQQPPGPAPTVARL